MTDFRKKVEELPRYTIICRPEPEDSWQECEDGAWIFRADALKILNDPSLSTPESLISVAWDAEEIREKLENLPTYRRMHSNGRVTTFVALDDVLAVLTESTPEPANAEWDAGEIVKRFWVSRSQPEHPATSWEYDLAAFAYAAGVASKGKV